MSSKQVVRVGDIATKLQTEIVDSCIPVDISSATTVTITIMRPDGTKVVKTGVNTTDGTDGKTYYLTDINDITMKGEYSIQAYIVLPDWTGYSSIGKFTVESNL